MQLPDDTAEFERQLLERFPEEFLLGGERLGMMSRLRALILDENTRQNLTRLTTVGDFIEGHLRDVVELERSGLLPDAGDVVDWGSGCGVPGLACAAYEATADKSSIRKWVLIESEGRKAEFLTRATQELGLTGRVAVISGRGEVWIKARKAPVAAIVARAVGPVTRFWGWLADCSTWNSLIFFKGPRWAEEWNETKRLMTPERGFTSGRIWEVAHEKLYGPEDRLRLVQVVPRGTK